MFCWLFIKQWAQNSAYFNNNGLSGDSTIAQTDKRFMISLNLQRLMPSYLSSCLTHCYCDEHDVCYAMYQSVMMQMALTDIRS